MNLKRTDLLPSTRMIKMKRSFTKTMMPNTAKETLSWFQRKKLKPLVSHLKSVHSRKDMKQEVHLKTVMDIFHQHFGQSVLLTWRFVYNLTTRLPTWSRQCFKYFSPEHWSMFVLNKDRQIHKQFRLIFRVTCYSHGLQRCFPDGSKIKPACRPQIWVLTLL